MVAILTRREDDCYGKHTRTHTRETTNGGRNPSVWEAEGAHLVVLRRRLLLVTELVWKEEKPNAASSRSMKIDAFILHPKPHLLFLTQFLLVFYLSLCGIRRTSRSA